MNNKYKIVISNRNLYREVELPVDAKTYRIGTSVECDYRLHKELFFEDIRLDFINNDGAWSVMCADNLYITVGDTRRLLTTTLNHGDSMMVKYQDSDNDVFTVEFTVDFDSEQRKFERRIDLTNIQKLSIGVGNENDIVIHSEYVTNDKIVLTRNSSEFILNITNVTYGIYHNGNRTQNNAVIKNGDFIAISDVMFYYKDETLWTEAGSTCEVRNLPYTDEKIKENYPLFVRNTRVKSKIDDESIKILDPDAVPAKPQLNIVTSLMPTLMMFALVVVLKGIMNTSGGTYALFSICSMGMGVVTSVLNIVDNRKKYKKDSEARIQTYNKYIEKKRTEIEREREKELQSLRNTYYSAEESIQHILEYNTCLFDRLPEDKDYLEVYLGRGKRKAANKIDYKEQEKLEVGDELTQIPAQLAKEYEYIDEAPITVALKEANAIGIVGDDENLYEMFKIFVIDLVSRQYHGDLDLYAFLDTDTQKYEWIRMIPHFQNENVGRNVINDNQSKNAVFETLFKELTMRAETQEMGKYNVVLIMNEQGIKNHPISRFIEGAGALNTVFVFFENKEELLPLHCSKVIKLSESKEGQIFDSENKNNMLEFTYDKIGEKELYKVSQMLAPSYCEEISLEGTLRKNITLFELLNIYSVEDIDLQAQWEQSKIYETMAAPLGVNAKDEVISLNLHEKAHGPHGLVAGTTGSGKSEILQSYILSAATLFHPYEIAFVIIDFKGGGMVNQFKNLPHLVGAITNIDGKEIQRSLKSIKAELLKRQTLFAEANVNHIDKYIRLYKDNKVAVPLPHLVIIVDEFAELKAEQPEFMRELISAARIGRSLGIHLILATQKPAGQVNEQIWSNSKFKLCLKVQNQEDSKEVLKSPLAAEIREPGRAYLQVGNNEIFELFQSAYSGAPAVVGDDNSQKKFNLLQCDFNGRKTIVYEKKVTKTKENTETQLEAIVNKIQEHCAEKQIERLPNICLPSLTECIVYEKRKIDADKEMVIPLGIFDDPDSQYQGEMLSDFGRQNTIIVGTTQMGKTNILQLLIRSLCDQNAPEYVSMYIMDFGSMVLKIFENLKHVGGVVLASEDEKIKNLFKLMMSEMENRKKILLKMGVSSYVAYKEAGGTDIPKTYLMIDNFNAFKELYLEAYETEFIKLCRDGISLGISVVITNSSTNGIGYRHISNFENRICLTCAETTEYSNVFDRCRMEPNNVAGRALVERNRTIYEMQTYLAFEGKKEIERSKAMKEYVDKMNDFYFDSKRVKLIPAIPETLGRKAFEIEYRKNLETNLVPIGLDFGTIEPICVNLREDQEITFIAKKKENAVRFMDTFIRTALFHTNAELYIVDSFARALKAYTDYPQVQKYTMDVTESETMLEEIMGKLQRRKEMLAMGQEISGEKTIILVINSKDALEYISGAKPVLGLFNEVTKTYKNYGVFVIYGDIEDEAIPYGAPEILKHLKDSRKALVLDNLPLVKIYDVNTQFARNHTKPLSEDEGYWFYGTEMRKVKLITED